MIKNVLISIAAILLAINIGVTNAQNHKVETILEGLDSPWSLAFLPDNRMLITELTGRLHVVDAKALKPKAIENVPDVYYAMQGGLMDVMVDRDFTSNQRIYLSYAHGERGDATMRLISARLIDNKLVDQQILFTASPRRTTPHHYGGRMAQLADGSIVMGVGDGFNYREQAQKLDNHFGKIIRITSSGATPADNPYLEISEALPEIWSYGHRNPQAILIGRDGTIYEHEHGPKGGDEVNIIEPGNNYGWPVITHGVDYSGAQITPYTEYQGMRQPIVNWTPSIAPAGMTEYTGALFPDWQGDLFAVSLSQRSVRKVRIKDGELISDEHVFPELNERMRDIRTGPDGALYILTDGEGGKLLRITPE